MRMRCTVRITGRDGEVRIHEEHLKLLDHQVRFDGLTPGTYYDYAVNCDSHVRKGSVKTAPDARTPFSFLVYGDNRWDIRQHTAVVRAMMREKPDFLLNTGDLVNDGTVGRYWYDFFRVEGPMLASVPLYPAPGNHEKVYQSKGVHYWRRFFELPHNGPADELTYYFDWGNTRIFVLDYNRPFVASSQGRWFRATLEETAMEPSIQHIFVVVHRSPYTSGPHGPNRELLASGLVDDMRRYGVDILFAGHDHIYERGRVDGLNYVISGGGGAPIYYVRRSVPYSLVTEPVLHYVRIDVRGPEVSLTAYRMDGSMLDFMVLRKKLDGGVDVKVLKEAPERRVFRRVGTPEPDEEDLVGDSTANDGTDSVQSSGFDVPSGEPEASVTGTGHSTTGVVVAAVLFTVLSLLGLWMYLKYR